MKRGLRRLLALVLLLLALLAGLWQLIPDVDSSADIDARLGQERP